MVGSAGQQIHLLLYLCCFLLRVDPLHRHLKPFFTCAPRVDLRAACCWWLHLACWDGLCAAALLNVRRVLGCLVALSDISWSQ